VSAKAELVVIKRLAKYGFGECVELDANVLEVPNDPDDPKAFQRKGLVLGWTTFVPALFGRPIVAEVRNGRGKPRLLILDGQHRIKEAKTAGYTEVPCILFKGLTFRDAAAMFDILNSDRMALKPADEFRAACISEAPAAMALDEALLERGLDGWGRGRAAINLGAVSSVRKLQRDIRPDGLGHVNYTLDVLAEIWPWPETLKSPHVRCIRGFGQFLREKKVIEEEKTGRKVLREWDPAERGLLVAHLTMKYQHSLPGFLALAEAKVQGGGGGGGSKGMEWLLLDELVEARQRAGLPARPLKPSRGKLDMQDQDDLDLAEAA